jgi:hypothetical protein
MRVICNYSILRFLPYPQTGEFVNIGIVLFANNGDFRYKVESKRQRVTTFFPSLDGKIFMRARKEINVELARLSGFFTNYREDRSTLKATFSHLIHPRETMMRFSDPGSIVALNSDVALKALFDHYVNHSFATKEYQEATLERQLGKLLADVNLKKHYVDRKIGTEDYPVKFPFVLIQGGRPAQALKPLHLGHDEPGKILEHGDAWAARVRRLNNAKLLPADTVFVAGPPVAGKKKLFKAYREVAAELSAFPGVRVISSEEDTSKIISLIREGIPESADLD